MKRQNGWRAALALGLASGLATPGSLAVADAGASESRSVTEELLGILLGAGTIDQAQYDSLSARARLEQEQRVATAVERAVAASTAAVSAHSPVEAGPEDWDFAWNNGFRLERNDGAFEFRFGGRIQNDWALIDAADAVDDALGVDGNGTEFRRARLYFEGTMWEDLYFKAQYDFANTGDGSVDVKDLYIGMHGLGPVGSVSVGHFKEPFSLESLTSSKYLTFMERSLAVFAPGRNVGIMAFNPVLDERLLWQVGVFKRTNTSGFGFNDDHDWNVSARLVAVPLYRDEGERVVHLGLGYSHQFRDDGFRLRYQRRPQSHLAPPFADTGSSIATDGIDLINSELAVVWGPASFQAQYTHSFVSGRDGGDLDFWGAYAQASYIFTGEHRNYHLGAGRFTRLSPRSPFNPGRGDWGAWEIAARFSVLDLQDRGVRGGEMWDVTAGINWYPYSNARVLLNYVHTSLSDRRVLGPPEISSVDGDADIVEMRLQLDF